MQSMPYYQQGQGYQTQSPYQTNAPNSNVLNNGPSMMNHPNGLPPLQHPGMPDQSQVGVGGQQQPKRKQVKNACTNCQKACKKCDDARPCPRCIKYGIADTCVNSVRKERKKGIKRGPYKRRQKTGEEKPRKTANDLNNNDQNGQAAQYAPSMRGPAMPFAYPSNLNQYGQPYDPYQQYSTYHKDSMMPQPYVVNPVYPPMGYPVLVGGENGQQQQPSQQPQPQQQPSQQQQQQQHPYQQQQQPSQQQQHSPMPQQHYNNIIHQQQQQQQSPQTSRPPMMQQHNEHVMHQPSPAGSPQVYYQQQQQHSQPPSQRSSPHLPDIKNELSKPMTPVPSTSTSTATTSSPDSGSWVPPRSN